MHKAITSRERVLSSINHVQPERIPLDIQATPEAWRKLIDHFGTQDSETILQQLGVDIRYLSPVSRYTPIQCGDGCYLGEYGQKIRRVENETGAYEEVVNYPLDHAATPDEILAFQFPDPATVCDYSRVASVCHGWEQYAIVGGYASIFYIPTLIRSMEKILLDMALYPDMVHTLTDKALQYAIAYNEPLLAAGKGRIDFLHMADDFATQRGLLMSVSMWRKYFRTPMKTLVDLAHSYGAKVMFHCCGAVAHLIPELIELGIELLDPVQTTAEGMSPEQLKNQYGNQIAFHGAIDTQHVLPHGTPEDVRREVYKCREVLGRDGGYVLSPCHALQSDVPLENILAMYDAAKQ